MISLDGNSISLKDIPSLAGKTPVSVASSALEKIQSSRQLVQRLTEGSKPVYGINTGFGYFSRTCIPLEELRELQENIIKSHASGYGPALSQETTRLAMCLRLNVLCKGLTGVRLELCKALAALINSGIYPIIPTYGSVGASGDLAPLAHLALPLIGQGDVIYKGKLQPASEALESAGLQPIQLAEKEGLSLINGTQIMLSVGSLAFLQGRQLAELADQIAALTMEAMDANPSFLNPKLHEARGQIGQITAAQRMREALEGSYLFEGHRRAPRVQDPYSMRCAPQIHGPSRDMLDYVGGILERELNAATDNPLLVDEESISGGNFHGQALAISLDSAAMALSELGNVSERRLEQLLNPHLSGLPAFLSPKEGTHSGYMAIQYLSASLVNDSKLHANPACTDSIPGNVGVEDHVSMGSTSARKLQHIADNLKTILAVELVAAAQAVDLRDVKPLGKKTQQLYDRLRATVPPLDRDRIVSEDVTLAVQAIEGILAEAVDKP